MVTQRGVAGNQAETHDFQSRGHFPPLPFPQPDFFNSAFCKGNRMTLQPARIQTAQFQKPLWAGWGPGCNSIQLLVLSFSLSPSLFLLF